MLYRVHLAWVGFELATLVVIGTDCTDSWKATITTTTAPIQNEKHMLYGVHLAMNGAEKFKIQNICM
jgi:hypothetical protein